MQEESAWKCPPCLHRASVPGFIFFPKELNPDSGTWEEPRLLLHCVLWVRPLLFGAPSPKLLTPHTTGSVLLSLPVDLRCRAATSGAHIYAIYAMVAAIFLTNFQNTLWMYGHDVRVCRAFINSSTGRKLQLVRWDQWINKATNETKSNLFYNVVISALQQMFPLWGNFRMTSHPSLATLLSNALTCPPPAIHTSCLHHLEAWRLGFLIWGGWPVW